MRKAAAKHNRWQDHYARRAKKERFPARSVYKLKEMQQKYNLIKKGNRVLDLGCAPGSWLLYAANLTGNKGEVVGIDLKPLSEKIPSHVRVYRGDILCMDEDLFKRTGKDFNVVLSDMAPATTGNRHVDSARSFNLCRAALSIAQEVLSQEDHLFVRSFTEKILRNFRIPLNRNLTGTRFSNRKAAERRAKKFILSDSGKNRR
jgi:23S rRNA (uridine2552-2'-O)-methyltransferase